MQRTTPILTRDKEDEYYRRQWDAWVLSEFIWKYWVDKPGKISLEFDTRNSPKSWQIELRKPEYCRLDWRVVGTWRWHQVTWNMNLLLRRFYDAGHRVLYVTLYSHD